MKFSPMRVNRYEAGAPGGYDDILIGVLDELIEDVVHWYRELGSKDMFIVFYGMPPLEQLPDSDQEPDNL
ncbi:MULTISPECIES: hypothetical protein [unclassified Pseudomonas]|uniref:hypothetical protein n=1 Tax=unclassified Pseudomonas TaxID=196821 RepID=UPI002115C88A|nr:MULTISPECIES: hypothetical protein [unclassified Pseudomonas]